MFKSELTGRFAGDPLVMCKDTNSWREDCLASSNRPEAFKSGGRSISEAQLLRQMSEIISLREKVAQAELASHAYGQTLDQGGEEAPPKK
jgi:hypothetical protein